MPNCIKVGRTCVQGTFLTLVKQVGIFKAERLGMLKKKTLLIRRAFSGGRDYLTQGYSMTIYTVTQCSQYYCSDPLPPPPTPTYGGKSRKL